MIQPHLQQVSTDDLGQGKTGALKTSPPGPRPRRPVKQGDDNPGTLWGRPAVPVAATADGTLYIGDDRRSSHPGGGPPASDRGRSGILPPAALHARRCASPGIRDGIGCRPPFGFSCTRWLNFTGGFCLNPATGIFKRLIDGGSVREPAWAPRRPSTPNISPAT